MTNMKTVVVLSDEGQIAVPAELRLRHGWHSGARLELIEDGGAVRLQTAIAEPEPATKVDVEALLAELVSIANYTGPRISDEEIAMAGPLGAAERYRRACGL